MTQKNSLERLYQELGPDICLYPFFGAFYQTNHVIPEEWEGLANTIRPCSIVEGDIRAKWLIREGSLKDARNSPAWREMRRDFAEGRFHSIPDCRSCSYNEKSGTTSPRQMNNKFYTEFLDFDLVAATKQIIANDYQVDDIITLDYYPSNYCNYSCVMCAGGASTQRQVFELKVYNKQEKIVINAADPDFYDVLKQVKVINFTGGETVLQKQVHEIIDYLIQEGMAQDILITLLTNASSSPEKMEEKFRHFKRVIYNVSVDGTGDVIEYQRRGCSWPTVAENALKLIHHEFIITVVNYVLSGVNVFTYMDFIDWCYDNKIGPRHEWDTCQYITVSPVFRVDHLGMSALPPELRQVALGRLRAGRERYAAITGYYADSFVVAIDKVINIIESTPHEPEHIAMFVDHMRKEDTVSKKKLTEVTPEWASYFRD